MELIRARAADGVYNAASCSAICGRKSAGEHRKFLNRVNTQHDSDHVSGSGHRVIIDVDSINPVIVESGSLAGDRHFAAEAAVAAGGGRKGHLRLNLLYAGLQL